LEQQLQQVQAEGSRMGDAEQKISELLRRKKMLESTVEKYETQMQRTRIDEELEPGLVSGINKLQKPSPPFRDFAAYYKKVYMIMFGGFAFGLALAFLMEFYLDRTIKRPIEIQNKLKIPFFLSIPDLNQGARRASLAAPGRKLLGAGSGSVSSIGAVAVRDSSLEVMASAVNRRFDSYYDALRDRLVVYFESINLTRKPKLVAVTSTHKGAGVSTIAAGLASSLSETGDGRVLLVDMNMENGSAQQFFRGQPNCKLDDALESETRDGARVQENLYVVNEDTFTDKLPRALPKRFASLIPKLKASDYDYIIFDMPPVSPTSVTARLSGFMDTVMLVIESEKTDQQVVQQANALLLQSKANVTAVLNKTKTYIPKKLHQDFLSEV
jgi:Mrp family chromosome partitioning ATPase